MNSAAPPHQHHHHAPHQQLVFGQLPPTTYEAAPAPISVDTSSPPLGGYGYPAAQLPPHQAPPAPSSAAHPQLNGAPAPAPQRRGPGSIKWTKEGVSTSAERRLPFVHRFRPVGLPPPAGLVSAAAVAATPAAGQQQQQQQLQFVSAFNHPDSKILAKMSQYETNPVGALQERFQSRGIMPSYQMVQFEGMSHNPVFTYEVIISDVTAIGSGNSKKQAKHAAARAMLDKLDGRYPMGGGGSAPSGAGGVGMKTEVPDSNSSTAGSTSSSASHPSNPIGCLQEFCVKFSLPLPIYDLQNTSGQPHQRNFDIMAKVGSVTSSGTGTSKKDAKRAAASAMLAKLKSLGQEVANVANNGSVVILPNGSNLEPINANTALIDEDLLKCVAEMKIDTLTPKHSKVLEDFYKQLQDSGKPKLFALHRASLSDPNFGYVSLLNELGSEQRFEVTYVDIDEKSASGEHQCLVQLSTLPVAVCYGAGRDQRSANNNAAKNALNYLKIMTKKKSSPDASSPKDTKSLANGKKLEHSPITTATNGSNNKGGK